LFQNTKEIARAAGVDDNQKLGKIVDAVKFLSDVEDLAEEARIPYLHEFKAKSRTKKLVLGRKSGGKDKGKSDAYIKSFDPGFNSRLERYTRANKHE
ncbi:hypothetical protein Goklo_023063, partial [Gossypium klotzschianum]|nr:hypothetical protein [Gossypium klotzschianum]